MYYFYSSLFLFSSIFLFLSSVICPRITRNPVTQSVVTGAEATFRVEASGDDLEFHWQKNGINIGCNKSRLRCCKNRNASTLCIQHTMKGDKGHYRCVVKNPSEKDGKPSLEADLSVCKFQIFVLANQNAYYLPRYKKMGLACQRR